MFTELEQTILLTALKDPKSTVAVPLRDVSYQVAQSLKLRRYLKEIDGVGGRFIYELTTKGHKAAQRLSIQDTPNER